jgi:acyl-lipid omega-6 desaturase (Delta-12 desaturase)
MSSAKDSQVPDGAALAWTRMLSAYRTPNALRGCVEIAVTATPFALAWFTMYWALMHGYLWLYVLLMLPTAGLMVRLFMIQHDCGHGAFFANKRANDWTGRLISIVTVTPYDLWRRAHSIHHATHGNLGRRGVGDMDTITVSEYLARSPLTRLRYRAYRNPLVMFGIGPLFVFLLQNRVPAGFMRNGWAPWVSTMATNLAIFAAYALTIWAVGITPFLMVHLPVVLLGAAIGIFLFYVQHQFEQSYWELSENWSYRQGALRGSSHYDLPPVLRWFTANIGIHHVHHLSSQIPYYRLPRVLREHPELGGVNRLTLLQSFKCLRLALWDEQTRRLISFAELRRLQRDAQPKAA